MSKLQKYLPLLLSVVAVIGMVIGMRLQSSLEADGYIKKVDIQSDRSIDEALQHIKSKYYGELHNDDLTNEVIDHMVDQLDGYSHYFKPSNDTLYNKYIKGLYNGVGIEYAVLDGKFYISSVVNKSPAYEAELQAGDRLLSIEGISLEGKDINRDSVMSLSDLMAGDTLNLEISTWPDNTIRDLAIPVSDIELSLVHDYIITAKKEISYVKIDRFYDGVFKEFMDALDYHAHDSSDVSHLIIDLRDNPGGVVDETIKILNQLITEKEKVLLKTIDKRGRSKVFKSNGRGFLEIEKIVIIINEKSASASEILAAVLQDYDRAVVIGTNSYGKGVIQQNYQLSNQGSVNLTVGEYVLPSGRRIDKTYPSDTSYFSVNSNRELTIDGAGVTPDVRMEGCDLAFKRSSIAEGLIQYNLWSQEQLELFAGEDRALMLANVYNVLPLDSCQNNASDHLDWYLHTERYKEGSRVPALKADYQIKKAVELILGDEYDRILQSN